MPGGGGQACRALDTGPGGRPAEGPSRLSTEQAQEGLLRERTFKEASFYILALTGRHVQCADFGGCRKSLRPSRESRPLAPSLLHPKSDRAWDTLPSPRSSRQRSTRTKLPGPTLTLRTLPLSRGAGE